MFNRNGRAGKRVNSFESETFCAQAKTVYRHFSRDVHESTCEQHKGLPMPNIDEADPYSLRQTTEKGYGSQVTGEN